MAKAKAKAPKVYSFPSLDDADTSIMSFEELQQFCLQIFEETLREKKEGEKTEIERDKLLKYWAYSADSLREALFDLRDQQLCLENDEYSMKTRMDRKVQDVRRLKSDSSETVENALLTRCAQLAKHHEALSEKEHQIWSDVQNLKSKLIDAEILHSETLTDHIYVKQAFLELVNKNMLRQRKYDLKRIKKELGKDRRRYIFDRSERYRKECRLKRDIMKSVKKKNNCSLRKLVSSFERILSYNFEKVSDLKDKAENLKKLDIMLSKEYSEASKIFYKSVSSHAEGMRTLNQMRTFLYAAGKTERNLVMKKKELATVTVEAEALSVKRLNLEVRLKEMEKQIKEMSRTVISYRKITTQMFCEDTTVYSRDIEKSLMELYQQKLHLYTLLSKDIKNIDLQDEASDMGYLTYRTENIGRIKSLLRDFHIACSAVVTLYQRLFKIWKIDYHDLGIVLNHPNNYVTHKDLTLCKSFKYI